MKKIIRNDEWVFREIEYTSEDERFDPIRLQPEIKYNANWEDDYDTFNSCCNLRGYDQTTWGQLHFRIQVLSIESYFEILTKLIRLGYKNRIIYPSSEVFYRKYRRVSPRKFNFTVNSFIEFINNHEYAKDAGGMFAYPEFYVNVRIDYNKFERFRQDIKNLCLDLHYKVVNWISDNNQAPYVKGPDKYIIK